MITNDEPTLFDMNSVLMDSPRLKEIKKHDIQTHYAPHMEAFPWLSIPMNAARAMLKGSGLTENESRGVAEIMAGYCRLLDDAGMTFLGETEHDVQEDALAWCRSTHLALSATPGSPGLEVKMIRGVAVEQCPVCGCFHPDEPFFEDSTYTFYDSQCWVVDNRANANMEAPNA